MLIYHVMLVIPMKMIFFLFLFCGRKEEIQFSYNIIIYKNTSKSILQRKKIILEKFRKRTIKFVLFMMKIYRLQILILD
jgi:hypothetical protein